MDHKMDKKWYMTPHGGGLFPHPSLAMTTIPSGEEVHPYPGLSLVTRYSDINAANEVEGAQSERGCGGTSDGTVPCYPGR